MTTEAPLDALILGDSQAIALKAGCDKLGLRTALLSLSGNFWHGGFIRMHRHNGLIGRGAAQTRIEQFKQRSGFEIVPRAGLPVIATFGFHLGRIVPMFAVDGHRSDEAEFHADETAHFVSRGMLRAYADSFRRPHIEILRRIARLTPTLLVAPPLFSQERNPVDFTDAILAMMAEAGLNTLNPCAGLFGAGKAVPEDHRSADGHHGNDEYGTKAMRLVLQSGFLKLP
jgi:hypothetical protein